MSFDFDKGEYKKIFKEIHECHPFTYVSPNLVKAGKSFSATDWLVAMEITSRLKYESGSFLLKNDAVLQKKLNKDFDEIELSIERLISFGIISILDKSKNIYQVNPIMMWKGSMQTLLDRNKELYNICTFTLKEKYQTADELTAKRVIEIIQKTQEELHPVLNSKLNDKSLLDLEGEEWAILNNDECSLISNKGRFKYSSTPAGKERFRQIDFGRVSIKGKYYNVKELVKEYFGE